MSGAVAGAAKTDDIIQHLVAGRWRHPVKGELWSCPVKSIVVAPSLDRREDELLQYVGLRRRLAVVADENTAGAMGRRVASRLASSELVVLESPHADVETAGRLAEACRHADGLVAVGSGTINDLCKYVSHLKFCPYAVFATAPSMNGYVTGTASLERAGLKLSLPATSPVGAFFDLSVLTKAPARLIRAGFGDALSRTTAQSDWLLSHRLRGTCYDPAPFLLQETGELAVIERAHLLAGGDVAAIEALIRLLILGGIGMLIAGSSAPASQGEHLISHFLEMHGHEGSLHGEQVAVATWTMARLQALVVECKGPPILAPTVVDEKGIRQRFPRSGEECIGAMKRKAIGPQEAEALNRRLAHEWPAMRDELADVMLPMERLGQAMRAAALPMSAEDLGLPAEVYRGAVLHAREIRDRWTMLDLAGDAGMLEAFAQQEK